MIPCLICGHQSANQIEAIGHWINQHSGGDDTTPIIGTERTT